MIRSTLSWLLCLGLSGCGAELPQRSTPEATYDSPIRELHEADGDALMQVLIDSGLTDTSGLLGALNLTSSRIFCTTYVLFDGVPDCTIDDAAASRKVPKEAARTLLQLLLKYEAFTPGPLGVNKLWIKDVSCSRPVVPQAQADCRFSVGP